MPHSIKSHTASHISSKPFNTRYLAIKLTAKINSIAACVRRAEFFDGMVVITVPVS